MNQREFSEKIAPFQDKIFRLAKRLLVSVEEAQDASQEVLLKLWTRNNTLHQYSSLEALAMVMTKNFCFDQLKSKRAAFVKIDNNDFFTKDRSNLDQKIEDSDTMQWVQKIIDRLPEQQKMLIQLREIEQMEFDQIAEISDMNPVAIRVALSRARKTIRENIEKTHQHGTRKH